jgi:hypothetical protein
MASFRELLEEEDTIREPRAATSAEQPPALTPLHELARGDGYRWASLDGEDLDPPTSLPPY